MTRRVGHPCPQPHPAVVDAPLGELGDPGQVEQRGRAVPVEVQLDHHVGATGDGYGAGVLGLGGERLGQRPGCRNSTASAPSVGGEGEGAQQHRHVVVPGVPGDVNTMSTRGKKVSVPVRGEVGGGVEAAAGSCPPAAPAASSPTRPSSSVVPAPTVSGGVVESRSSTDRDPRPGSAEGGVQDVGADACCPPLRLPPRAPARRAGAGRSRRAARRPPGCSVSSSSPAGGAARRGSPGSTGRRPGSGTPGRSAPRRRRCRPPAPRPSRRRRVDAGLLGGRRARRRASGRGPLADPRVPGERGVDVARRSRRAASSRPRARSGLAVGVRAAGEHAVDPAVGGQARASAGPGPRRSGSRSTSGSADRVSWAPPAVVVTACSTGQASQHARVGRVGHREPSAGSAVDWDIPSEQTGPGRSAPVEGPVPQQGSRR